MARLHAVAPAPLPDDVAAALNGVLRDAHTAEPFLPHRPRDAAHRVLRLADAAGLPAGLRRGVLDLGTAELDHVFAVVAGRVVDPSMPLRDERFVRLVHGWIAGDVVAEELVTAAADLDLDRRVLGEYPETCRYRGAPVWGAAA